MVSRGAGRSAVAAAAYLSCSRMLNEYDGFFPIQLSRYSSPERETRFASMCRWACSFLLI